MRAETKKEEIRIARIIFSKMGFEVCFLLLLETSYHFFLLQKRLFFAFSGSNKSNRCVQLRMKKWKVLKHRLYINRVSFDLQEQLKLFEYHKLILDMIIIKNLIHI